MFSGLEITVLSEFNDMEKIVVLYLVVINILSFAAMGMDKSKAKKHKYRISEGGLIALSVIGGAIGSLVGMVGFRHKTSKKKFYVGIPIIYVFNQIMILFIFNIIK